MEIRRGQKVFITGAGSGIGRATAIAMGRLGVRLFLTDINRQGLEKTAGTISQAGGEIGRIEAFDRVTT